jgi:hypothetical protein
MKTKIIFIDVDGVLNNSHTTDTTPDGFNGIDPENVKNLKKILIKTDAKIVLSSQWRLAEKDKDYLWEHTGEFIKSRYIGDTPIRLNPNRFLEISEWLDKNKDIVDDYIILDDNKVWGLEHKLILTDDDEGLTGEIAYKIIKLLNEKE